VEANVEAASSFTTVNLEAQRDFFYLFLWHFKLDWSSRLQDKLSLNWNYQKICHCFERFSMRYQIKVSGSGGSYGIGSLNKEQYDFWHTPENNLFLPDAARLKLEERTDINLLVPNKARFQDHYSTLNDIGTSHGPLVEFALLTIIDEAGREVFHGEYEVFKDRYESESEYQEISLPENENSKFLFWINSANGNFFTATIETDDFEPEFLSFIETDIYGEALLLTAIHYENEELKLIEGDIKSFNEEFILLSND